MINKDVKIKYKNIVCINKIMNKKVNRRIK